MPDVMIAAEIEAYLDAVPITTPLGLWWYGHTNGLSHRAIADMGGRSTPPSHQRSLVDLLLEERLPSLALARKTAMGLHRLTEDGDWSPQCADYLDELMCQLQSALPAQEAVALRRSIANTQRAEVAAVPGVYVYADPHYLRHPTDPATGRTDMKVGHSGSDVVKRFQQQTRITSRSRDPILLRVYQTDDSAVIERVFHNLLIAAGHYQTATDNRLAGTEWFVTSLEFLDEVARSLGLPINVVNEPLCGVAEGVMDHA